MSEPNPTQNDAENLRCPECRAVLKKRRSRHADACEMLCGGCGASFDVCDPDTLETLKKNQQQ